MNLPCGADVKIVSGCSKRLDFSPAQPWRAETRLFPSKAAASDPNMILLSLLVYIVPGMAPTHWHAETCHEPGRGSSDFPHFAHRGTARLSFPARIGRALFYRARSASKKDVWLLPFLPSEAACCASTGESPGHPSPAGGLFQHHAREKGIRPRY
jgi:hypothetical protein